jgi:phage tail sheath gpL-like
VIQSNIRVPGSYNEVDASGANNRLPLYRQPLVIIAPRIKTPAAWVLTTVTALGAKVKPTAGNDDGHYYICVVAGTTGSTEPTWPGASGSVTDGTATWRELCNASEIVAVHTPTSVFSPDDGARFAGAGSIAHRMVRAALRQYRRAEVSIITVDDDDTGICATSTLTFSGTADGQGFIIGRIGNEKFTYTWEDTATAAEIAIGIDAIIAALHDLPATSSVATSVLTLRAKNAGVPGMELGKYDTDSANYKPEITIYGNGITVVITGFASGANNADITDALTAATAGAYKLVAVPYKDADNVAALRAYLLSVSDEVNCQGARAWLGTTATMAIAITLAGLNDERMHVAFVNKCRFVSFEVAAAAAVMHAQTGHPALPLNTMQMVDCDAPDIADRLEFSEINNLLLNGVTPFNADGYNAVRIVRSITTYLASSSGSPDDTYLDTTVIACLDYLRLAIKTGHALAYSQSVLRENHINGEPSFVVTPGDVRSFNIAICKKVERYGAVQQVDALVERFETVRDENVPGRVNSDIPVEVVQGLHILANTIRLTTTI